MKKYILIIAALASLTLHAQETKLSLEVIPGKLATQLTEEQKQVVTDLTFTGNLNQDDFYFMRDLLPNLKNVDLKQTAVDTIPARAFYNKDMDAIILPLELKYIDEDAFSTETIRNNMSVYVTGKYPKRATYIIRDNGQSRATKNLEISQDNIYLITNEYGMVFSADGKSLYDLGVQYILFNYEFHEGLEVIESYAFLDISFCGYYIFPSTLKEIKAHAFYHFEGNFPVGGNSSMEGNSFMLRTKTPPVLDKEAFVNNTLSYLLVPNGCSNAYKEADIQWVDMFLDIIESNNPLDPPSSIQSMSPSMLSIVKNGMNWQLSGNQVITQVAIYSTFGSLIQSQKYNSATINIPIMQQGLITFAKVQYENGNMEIIKLIN